MIYYLSKLDPAMYPIIKNSNYIYNGIVVPRVTTILSDMLHEDGLMGWSNYIGLYKRQKYKDVLDAAADKGTYVHNGIENYITNNVDLDIEDIPLQYQEEVNNAFQSFLTWWNIVNKNTIEVLMQEEPLVCQWFGGTLDLLLKINDKIFLIDFKTSNHLSYKYLLQLSAYRYMLRNIHNIEVDGVGIIRLEKTCINFEEIIIDLHVEDDLILMNHCEVCFASLVNGYYERKYIEEQFKEKLKEI